MIIRRLLFICICILCIHSCHRDNKEILHGGNYKYWYFKEKGWNVPLFYYFDDTGKWTIFVAYKTGFEEYDGGYDVIYKKRWEIKNDSILNINGFDLDILEINDDSIVIRNDYQQRTIYAAPDSMIPEEFRKKM